MEKNRRKLGDIVRGVKSHGGSNGDVRFAKFSRLVLHPAQSMLFFQDAVFVRVQLRTEIKIMVGDMKWKHDGKVQHDTEDG